MTPEQLIARVDHILVTEFELDPDQVVPTANLRDDLELDSLDALDLIVLLEKEFGFKVAEEEIMLLDTVAEVHEYLAKRFAEQA